MTTRSAVTGAFSYTGKYITRRLLAQGHTVLTLTGHLARPNPFGESVKAIPYSFESPAELVANLQGVDTFYNTYWVRFSHGDTTFDLAVKNTRTLIQAARAAGVQRFVHVSISNPTLDSPLPYFRGKAHLERDLQNSGLSYAILRPTVVFGLEDILINNIAYLLRRCPVFAVPGKGDYCMQPVYVEDLADIAVQAGQSSANEILDVVGPEIFTFNAWVKLLNDKMRAHALILHLPPDLALALAKILGVFLQDVMLTRDEVAGLMADLLVSNQPPLGKTRLSDWLEQNHQAVGSQYASELARHYHGKSTR